MQRSNRPDASGPDGTVQAASVRWTAILLAAAAFALYLRLAPPVSGDKDASEFALVLATNGVAHPTGYPLYTLAGHAFVVAVHGLGATWPLAANAWSALGGAAAVALLFLLAERLVRMRTAAGRGGWSAAVFALPPVLVFALDPAWTVETTLAEVHSWHVAWACGAALHACASFCLLTDGRAEERAIRRRALGWALICGIGAAHHATSVLVAVPLSVALVVLLVRTRRLRAVPVAATLLCASVPVVSYALIAWRAFHPAEVQWPQLAASWSGVLDHVTGAQYRHYLGGFAPSALQRNLMTTGIYPFLGIGLAALVTFAAVARDLAQRTIAWSLVGVAAIGAAYAFSYGVSDPSSYFLVPTALGLAAVAPLVASVATASRLRVAVPAVALALAVAPAPGWLRTAAERRDCHVAYDAMLRSMWTSIPADEGIVLFADDMSARLREYQLFHGERPQLDVVNPVALGGATARAAFERRYGFDPLADARPAAGTGSAEPIADTVARTIRRRSTIPVFVFDPTAGTVTLLPNDPLPPVRR